MREKENLDFNLDFLDQDTSSSNPSSSNAHPSGRDFKIDTPRRNWGWIIAGSIIAIFVIIGIFSDSSSSTSTSSSGYTAPTTSSVFTTSATTKTSDNVIVGQYTCTSYNATRADELNPGLTEKSLLDTENQRLGGVESALNASDKQIQATYVDNYSQYSVDNYNRLVNSYNAKLNTYKSDLARYNARIDAYNVKIDAYNNFLSANCTKN